MSLVFTTKLLAEKDSEIKRLLRGIASIRDYLDQDRIGDASFVCEALLAGSAYQEGGMSRPKGRDERTG